MITVNLYYTGTNDSAKAFYTRLQEKESVFNHSS